MIVYAIKNKYGYLSQDFSAGYTKRVSHAILLDGTDEFPLNADEQWVKIEIHEIENNRKGE